MITIPHIHLLPTPEHLQLCPDPATYLRQVLDYIATSAPDIFANAAQKRETYYWAALAEFASTYHEETAPDLLNDLGLLCSLNTAVAAPDLLRRRTLAYHGFTRDQAEFGPMARSWEEWFGAAETALTTYRERVVVNA